MVGRVALCVVGRVVGRVVALVRDVFVVGRVVVRVLFCIASLLVVVPRVVRVPTAAGLAELRVRVVLPTLVRVPPVVARVVRPVTIRPLLSRATRELETRDVFTVRVL